MKSKVRIIHRVTIDFDSLDEAELFIRMIANTDKNLFDIHDQKSVTKIINSIINTVKVKV